MRSKVDASHVLRPKRAARVIGKQGENTVSALAVPRGGATLCGFPDRGRNADGRAMRIIGRYILTGFVVTFFASLTVLTFVMSIGVLLKLTDLIALGVAWRPVLKVFGLAMPAALSFGIPVSLLATSLLMFSRLSADQEITAMKACGISMWSIVSRPLLFSLLLAVICLSINSYIAPMAVKMRRDAVAQLGMLSPLELLQEGRFIERFDGLSIHISRRARGELRGIRIIDSRDASFRREIQAESGTVTRSDEGRDLS